MTLRDDMVFAPDLGPQHTPTARVRAREERHLDMAKRRGGVLAKARAARRLQRSRKMKRRAKSGRRSVGAARAGVRGLAARGAARGASRLLANPIGAVVAAVVVAGIAAVRLATGEPLEGTGEMINKMILGDMDDEARAKMATRQLLQSDSHLTRIAGIEGSANSQIASLGDDLFKLNKEKEIGASLLRREFPANNTLDMLILRAAEAFRAGWNGTDGEGAVDRFKTKYKAARNEADGKTVR